MTVVTGELGAMYARPSMIAFRVVSAKGWTFVREENSSGPRREDESAG